jgi:hypothetical protein
MALKSLLIKWRSFVVKIWLAVIIPSVLVVLIPFVFARFLIGLAWVNFPTWAQVFVVVVLFVLLSLWAWLISGDRGVHFFTQLFEKGIKWPFLFSVSMLLFALVPFAALSSMLADHGLAVFEPAVPKGEFWRLQDLYAWHFLNSVPSLKIPETLLWNEPLAYKDHLSGALLLAFKIVVVAPVIASFAVWIRLRKGSKPATQAVPEESRNTLATT